MAASGARAAPLNFYRNLLGTKSLRLMEVAARPLWITYRIKTTTCSSFAPPDTQHDRSIYGHFALRWTMSTTPSDVAVQGVSAEPGTLKPAGTGLGRIGIIRDPDGVKIELVDRADLRDL